MKVRATLITAFILLVTCLSTARAQDPLYWDINGTNPNASDDGNATGDWDSVTSNWSLNTSLNGTDGTQAWDTINTPVAIFSAGGSSSYIVTLTDAETASGISFRENDVTIASTGPGELTLIGTATIDITSSIFEDRISAPIAGSNGLNLTATAASGAVLALGGANTYTGATTVGAGATLKLSAAGVIPDSSVVTLTHGDVNTGFQLNGFDETVKSIATTSTGSAPTIALGTNKLTLEDDGETQTYAGLYTSAGTADNFAVAHGIIEKNGDGTLILNNFPNGFIGGEFILNDGVLGISQNNSLGTVGNGSKLVINGGTIRKTGAAAAGTNWGVHNVDINASFSFDINGTNNTQLIGGSAATAGNSIITLGAENPTITVIPATSGASGILIFAGRVLNNAEGEESPPDRGFTKAGAGVLNLGNPHNDYRGETTILEGTLRVINQFFNLNSTANNGAATIGDGSGAVNLSGGTLQFNGSPQVTPDGTSNTGGARTLTVANPINVTADSSLDYFTTTASLGATNNIDFIFSSDDIGGSGGTLSMTNHGACTDNGSTCTFRPTFTGSGFDFDRPIVISNHTSVATRATQLVSGNPTGTQTWSGDISGDGSLKRTDAGTTILSGANTYSGGTTVDGGTLTASGASATFGVGDVTVTGGLLSILSGVGNAIDDSAALSISGTGMVDLGNGIDELIAALSLGGVLQSGGTYGSTASTADNQSDVYFSGMGILTVPSSIFAGDYNDDGFVDAADYVLWRHNEPTDTALANDSSPGSVDEDDYDTWVANFGKEEGGGGSGARGASGAVPEPGTFALAFLGLICVVAHRRRLA